MIILGRLFIATLLSGALLSGCSGREAEEEAGSVVTASSNPKNLLLICIDTVRADTFFQVSAVADDRLSAWEDKALVFTNAHATSPWTVPSIGSVFTGLLPAHHGAGLFPGAYGLLGEKPPSPMREGVASIADEALAAGYDTAVVSASAWTNGVIGLKNLMNGFSEFTAFDTPSGEADWGPLVKSWRDNDLQRARGGNFLHFLHLMEAHNWHANFDHHMERIYAGLTEQEKQEYSAMVPPNSCTDPDTKICRSFYVYAHAIRAMRDGIAEALDTLEREGLLDDTVVVLFSDHGEEFLDHFGDLRRGEGEETFKSLFEAFGHGKSLYQELVNVPLLVWHPDYAGKSVDAPVSIRDIAPSTMQWLGFAGDTSAWHGENLAGAGEDDTASERTIIGSALSDGEQQLSAMRDNKKAVWFIVSDHIDYYDLASDPGETTSLDDDMLVLKFDGLFLDYMESVPRKEVEKSSKLSDAQIRRLQSIGYLQGVDTEDEPEEPAAAQ